MAASASVAGSHSVTATSSPPNRPHVSRTTYKVRARSQWPACIGTAYWTPPLPTLTLARCATPRQGRPTARPAAPQNHPKGDLDGDHSPTLKAAGRAALGVVVVGGALVDRDLDLTQDRLQIAR